MEFEIVDAYMVKKTLKDQPSGWSFHLYFPSLEMDLRGLILTKTIAGWYLKMPYLVNFDMVEKKKVGYPVISFLDREKNRGFIEKIKKKCIEFALAKIAAEMEAKEKKDKKVNEKF